MKDSLESCVKALVARHFNLPPSKVRMDDSFLADLGGDALDLIEIGYRIEEAFDILLSPTKRDSQRYVSRFVCKDCGQPTLTEIACGVCP